MIGNIIGDEIWYKGYRVGSLLPCAVMGEEFRSALRENLDDLEELRSLKKCHDDLGNELAVMYAERDKMRTDIIKWQLTRNKLERARLEEELEKIRNE